MGATLGDAAVLYDQDLVGVPDRAQAVGDHDARAPGQELPERLLNRRFGAGVYVARRLVQDEDARVGEHDAGEGD